MSSLRVSSGRFAISILIRLGLLLTLVFACALCQAATSLCSTGALPPGSSQDPPDLVVNTGTCIVKAGTYHYHNVNVYGGGTLEFVDGGNIDFWAESILVENNGTLIAGNPSAPFSHTLTFHLWGKDQGVGTGKGDGGAGIRCLSDSKNQCGVDDATWTSNCPNNDCSMMTKWPPSCTKSDLPGQVNDCFYPYMPLDYDDGVSGNPPAAGFFGYKVLAVSYGGTLQLFGKKGASYAGGLDDKPWASGTSWARLNSNIGPGTSTSSTMVLDRIVDWAPGDKVVITTTDYLPGHSEQVQVVKNDTSSGHYSFVFFTPPVKFPHNGTTYDLGVKKVPAGIGPDQDPNVKCSPGQTRCVETRAAVGLLTRSIRIVSEGDTDNMPLAKPGMKCLNPDPSQPDSCVYFGGHTMVRQGAKSFQVQGVEFSQMGQGGRIMHYPIHFHMARQMPQGTFVKDSSVWDSMTRWYTIHGSQGITLARNVGYLSIGSGYYLEDGSETDNRLYSNLGVFARAGIDNKQNPRRVPGILGFDNENPTVFWMMNGWNDFQYNMASGAGTCGLCYWFLPANVSGDSQFERWFSYAGEQQGDTPRAGTTPLRSFVGNACTAAEYSFNTIGPGSSPCLGLNDLKPIPNNLPHDNPRIDQASSRQATQCPGDDCSQVAACAYSTDGSTEPNCMITDIDHYTSSFNWAPLDLSAIWLRKQWYLFTNSAVTDVQQGGLTFVSGGGYSGADEVPGYWALAHKSVFVGNTQNGNPYASNAGPFNPNGLACDSLNGSYCASLNEGISIPLNNFGNAQRLFSIYDGPAYEEADAFLDITKTNLTGCDQGLMSPDCKRWMNYSIKGTLWDPKSNQCYLPNAAIAWKQPNGFYYPPAFHSRALYFHNVDIRHFVVEPLFLPVGDDGFKTDTGRAKARYCGDVGDADHGLFQNFTDIDRQTELSDDDGSLTGVLGPPTNPADLKSPAFPSISVNKDTFFNVPLETVECASDIPELMPQGADCPYNKDPDKYPDLCGTANTSPYDYVTTVLFPDLMSDSAWSPMCLDPNCYGVPLYREDENSPSEGAVEIRMMGQQTSQRSNLTVNHGRYYIDTTVSLERQKMWSPFRGTNINVFQANHAYNVFVLFGKPSTSQIYDLFVGKSFDPATMLKKIRVDQEPNPPHFTDADPSDTFDCSDMSKECHFDSNTGYLSVTLDLAPSKDDYDTAAELACRPETFCTWDKSNKSCGCNPTQTSASMDECKNACGGWATKDIRCPKNAQGVSECYGFAFTLPADFTIDPDKSMPPPYIQCFNKENNWQNIWDIKFQPPDPKGPGAGSCKYTNLPGPAMFCPSRVNRGLIGSFTGEAGPGNRP